MKKVIKSMVPVVEAMKIEELSTYKAFECWANNRNRQPVSN